MPKILWIGIFTDYSGEQNWLFFAAEEDREKAVAAFRASYAESFDEEAYDDLTQGDPEIYPVKEADGYKVLLAKNVDGRCWAQVGESYCPRKAVKNGDYCREHTAEFGGVND